MKPWNSIHSIKIDYGKLLNKFMKSKINLKKSKVKLKSSNFLSSNTNKLKKKKTKVNKSIKNFKDNKKLQIKKKNWTFTNFKFLKTKNHPKLNKKHTAINSLKNTFIKNIYTLKSIDPTRKINILKKLTKKPLIYTSNLKLFNNLKKNNKKYNKKNGVININLTNKYYTNYLKI